MLASRTRALDSVEFVVLKPQRLVCNLDGKGPEILYLTFANAETSSPPDDDIPLSSLHVTEFRSSLKFASFVIFRLGELHVVVVFKRWEGCGITSDNDKSNGDSVEIGYHLSNYWYFKYIFT